MKIVATANEGSTFLSIICYLGNYVRKKDMNFSLCFIVMEITSYFVIHSLYVTRDRRETQGTDNIPTRKFKGGTRRTVRRANESFLDVRTNSRLFRRRQQLPRQTYLRSEHNYSCDKARKRDKKREIEREK